jgi:hypothetical protein
MSLEQYHCKRHEANPSSVRDRAAACTDFHGFIIDPSKTPDTLPEPYSPGTIVSLS